MSLFNYERSSYDDAKESEHIHSSQEHCAICRSEELSAAKAEIERLERLVGHTAEENKRLREALESISKNSCCAPCQEAGLWAKSALSQKDGK